MAEDLRSSREEAALRFTAFIERSQHAAAHPQPGAPARHDTNTQYDIKYRDSVAPWWDSKLVKALTGGSDAVGMAVDGSGARGGGFSVVPRTSNFGALPTSSSLRTLSGANGGGNAGGVVVYAPRMVGSAGGSAGAASAADVQRMMLETRGNDTARTEWVNRRLNSVQSNSIGSTRIVRGDIDNCETAAQQLEGRLGGAAHRFVHGYCGTLRRSHSAFAVHAALESLHVSEVELIEACVQSLSRGNGALLDTLFSCNVLALLSAVFDGTDAARLVAAGRLDAATAQQLLAIAEHLAGTSLRRGTRSMALRIAGALRAAGRHAS